MKKFKNIKLMLLGLLCLGSMNAFAADDLKTDGKFWYTVVNDAQQQVAFSGLSIVADPQTEIEIPATATLKNNLNKEVEYTVVGVLQAGQAVGDLGTDGASAWWTGYAGYTQTVDPATLEKLSFALRIDDMDGTAGKKNNWEVIVTKALGVFTSIKELKVDEAHLISTLPVLGNATYPNLTKINFAGVTNGGNPITLPGGFVMDQTIESITLPAEDLVIGGSAFARVKGPNNTDGDPTAVSINVENATSIGKWAFLDAYVTSVTIGAKCTDVNAQAFEANPGTAYLETLIWKSNKVINPNPPAQPWIPAAFPGQENLRNITINAKNLYSIEDNAFQDVVSDIDHPVSFVLAEGGAESLTAFMNGFGTTVPFFATVDLINGESLKAPNKKIADIVDLSNSKKTLKKLTLPKSVTELTSGEFQDYVALEAIGLNVNVPEKAFFNCSKLASLELGDNVATIGAQAFEGTSLTSIVIPEGVTSIGNRAFAKIRVKGGEGTTAKPYFIDAVTLNLANATKLNSIGEEAFYNTNVTSVDLSATKVVAVNKNTFSKGEWTTTEDYYPTTEGSVKWNNQAFLTTVKLHNGAVDNKKVSIADNAFSGNPNLTTVTGLDQADLEGIGKYAFAGCALKDNLDLSATGVKNIAEGAFIGNNIPSVKFNAETATIADYAFQGCTKLATVENLGNSELSSIGESAFEGSAIKDLDLSGAVKLQKIDEKAFAQYWDGKTFKPALETVKFPKETKATTATKFSEFTNQIKYVEAGAFLGASKLKSIENMADLKISTLNQWFSDSDPDDIDLPADDPSFEDWTVYCPGKLVVTLPADAAKDEDGNLLRDKDTNNPLYEGLETIDHYALQGLGNTDLTIPATVTSFGGCVLQGCIALTNLTWNDAAIDDIPYYDGSMVDWEPGVGLHKYTFRGNSNLAKFEFYTVDPITSGGLQDIFFYWCSKDKLTVFVTPESLAQLLADGYTTANAKYSKLNDEMETKITLSAYNEPEKMYYRTYYNDYYSTWIKASEGLKVYTAQFNGSKVEMIDAKTEKGKDNETEYYKINQYYGSNPEEAVCIIASATPEVEVEYYAIPGNKISTLETKNNDLKVNDTGSDMAVSKLKFFFKLGKGPKGIGFYRITTGTFKPGAVYLQAADAARTADFYPLTGDETAIKAIEQMIENDAPLYNLQGVRVNGTQKGIFIKNGKKFIVK